MSPRLPSTWETLPPAVLRVIHEILRSDHPPEAKPPGPAEDASTTLERAGAPSLALTSITPYLTKSSKETFQVRTVSHLLRRVDAGEVSVAELNLFLTLASVSPETTRRAIFEMGLSPTDLLLNEVFYTVRGGQLLPREPHSREPHNLQPGRTPDLWPKALFAVLCLGLGFALLMHLLLRYW